MTAGLEREVAARPALAAGAPQAAPKLPPLGGVAGRATRDAARDAVDVVDGNTLVEHLRDPTATDASLRVAVANAPGRQLIKAVRSRAAWERVLALRIDPLSLPRLVDHGSVLAVALQEDHVLSWVLGTASMPRLMQLIARVESARAADALIGSPRWPELLRQLAEGTTVDPRVRPLLRGMFDRSSNRLVKRRLLELRFLMSFSREVGLGSAEFEVDVMPALWDSLERLPEGHTLGNDKLMGLLRSPRAASEPQGGYDRDSKLIELDYDRAHLNGPSDFARGSDALAHVDLFARVVTHEIGHSVAQALKLDVEAPRSVFATDPEFGRWREERADRVPRSVRAISDEAYGDRWYTDPPIVGSRAYIYKRRHQCFWSFDASFREGQHLSDYQFYGPNELFAEIYAAFYLTAPQQPGKLVKAWRPKVYEWFVANVDRPVAAAKAAKSRT